MKRKNTVNKITPNIRSLRLYLVGGICGVMAIIAIFMTIETSTSGAEFAMLQKKEAELLISKQDLEQTLVQTLSINRLEEQSEELGFSKIGSLVYVSNAEAHGEPVAKLPY